MNVNIKKIFVKRFFRTKILFHVCLIFYTIAHPFPSMAEWIQIFSWSSIDKERKKERKNKRKKEKKKERKKDFKPSMNFLTYIVSGLFGQCYLLDALINWLKFINWNSLTVFFFLQINKCLLICSFLTIFV